MQFPYELYHTLAEPLTVYYPTGEEQLARWVFQTVEKAVRVLTPWLNQPMPDLEILVIQAADWQFVPRDEPEEIDSPHPYWTNSTTPPSLVVPAEIDAIFGEMTPEKLAFMLYHELALAFLEQDARPWPEDSPLWADEWQFNFCALWLARHLDGQQGLVNQDLRADYTDELFVIESDGKTPVTIRSFDWYADTAIEEYLCYGLLLEQFADDLLRHSGPDILPRFLDLYRAPHTSLLSDDVTEMLATALGPGGAEWLEKLPYF